MASRFRRAYWCASAADWAADTFEEGSCNPSERKLSAFHGRFSASSQIWRKAQKQFTQGNQSPNTQGN